MDLRLSVMPHPLMDAAAVVASFPVPLAEMATPPSVLTLFTVAAPAPLTSNDEIRRTVRDLLRHGGFKPTGRSKPASEYLIKAATGGNLQSINAAVDICNAVSLHSGLPMSVVDLDRLTPPCRLGIADRPETYVFNASGQEMELGGLLCLYDADGPIANPVKDSQRTKTSPESTRTLSIVWGSRELGDRTAQTTQWYCELLRGAGATIHYGGDPAMADEL